MKLFGKRLKEALTIEQRNLRKQHRILAVVSGILLGLSFPPIPLPYLMFAALIPYFIVLEQKKGLAEINRITYLMGFIFSLITIYWVGGWSKEADPFLMISGVALLFFNPTLFLIPSTLYYMARKLFNPRIALLLFPLFWVTYEYVYGITDIRFPWLILGHGMAYFHFYIQIADIIGAYGLTVLILLINISFYITYASYRDYRKVNIITLSAALLLFLIPLIYGIVRVNNFQITQNKVKIGLVQPNFNPWDKWGGGNLSEQLDQYLSLSQKCIDEEADLIVWPETALPVYLLTGSYSSELGRIRYFVNGNSTPLLTGMPDATFYFDKETAPKDAKPIRNSTVLYTSYNSILLFNPFDMNVQKYGKIKLVGFGERVPFVDVFPFLSDVILWGVGISNWNVGPGIHVFQIPSNKFRAGEQINLEGIDTVKVGGLVCIESVFPDFTAEFVQQGANLIAVVTNDSWWGNSSGPHQHKEINVLRAIENRRSVFQAANGGISCLIDPLGKTVLESQMLTKGYYVGEAPLEREITFYTKYPKIVLTVSYLTSLVILGLFIVKKIKTRFMKK